LYSFLWSQKAFCAKPWKILDFVKYTQENPGIFMTQTLEYSEKYLLKAWKTLENPRKPWNLNIKFCWQPWTAKHEDLCRD